VHPIYIDGAWADARAASAHEIKNPATLQVLDTVPDCGAEDVERAVGAATAGAGGASFSRVRKVTCSLRAVSISAR